VEKSHTVASNTVFRDTSGNVGVEEIESGNVDVFSTNVVL